MSVDGDVASLGGSSDPFDSTAHPVQQTDMASLRGLACDAVNDRLLAWNRAERRDVLEAAVRQRAIPSADIGSLGDGHVDAAFAALAVELVTATQCAPAHITGDGSMTLDLQRVMLALTCDDGAPADTFGLDASTRLTRQRSLELRSDMVVLRGYVEASRALSAHEQDAHSDTTSTRDSETELARARLQNADLLARLRVAELAARAERGPFGVTPPPAAAPTPVVRRPHGAPIATAGPTVRRQDDYRLADFDDGSDGGGSTSARASTARTPGIDRATPTPGIDRAAQAAAAAAALNAGATNVEAADATRQAQRALDRTARDAAEAAVAVRVGAAPRRHHRVAPDAPLRVEGGGGGGNADDGANPEPQPAPPPAAPPLPVERLPSRDTAPVRLCSLVQEALHGAAASLALINPPTAAEVDLLRRFPSMTALTAESEKKPRRKDGNILDQHGPLAKIICDPTNVLSIPYRAGLLATVAENRSPGYGGALYIDVEEFRELQSGELTSLTDDARERAVHTARGRGYASVMVAPVTVTLDVPALLRQGADYLEQDIPLGSLRESEAVVHQVTLLENALGCPPAVHRLLDLARAHLERGKRLQRHGSAVCFVIAEAHELALLAGRAGNESRRLFWGGRGMFPQTATDLLNAADVVDVACLNSEAMVVAAIAHGRRQQFGLRQSTAPSLLTAPVHGAHGALVPPLPATPPTAQPPSMTYGQPLPAWVRSQQGPAQGQPSPPQRPQGQQHAQWQPHPSQWPQQQAPPAWQPHPSQWPPAAPQPSPLPPGMPPVPPAQLAAPPPASALPPPAATPAPPLAAAPRPPLRPLRHSKPKRKQNHDRAKFVDSPSRSGPLCGLCIFRPAAPPHLRDRVACTGVKSVSRKGSSVKVCPLALLNDVLTCTCGLVHFKYELLGGALTSADFRDGDWGTATPAVQAALLAKMQAADPNWTPATAEADMLAAFNAR